MKITLEEIEQGFHKLGLSDDNTRNALSALAQMAQTSTQQRYETITAAHTALDVKEGDNA